MIMRWIAAVVAFLAAIATSGLVLFGNFSTGVPRTRTGSTRGREFVRPRPRHRDGCRVRGLRNRSSTCRPEGSTSISRQFDTRTIVLMPLAIAINIVLGQAVVRGAQDPDLPRFDRHDPRRRPGGPHPRRPHGLPAEHPVELRRAAAVPGRVAAAFAVVAAVIGLLAGVFAASAGCGRRPDRPSAGCVAGGVVALASSAPGLLRVHRLLRQSGGFAFFAPTPTDPLFLILAAGGRPAVVGRRRRVPVRCSSCAAT